MARYIKSLSGKPSTTSLRYGSDHCDLPISLLLVLPGLMGFRRHRAVGSHRDAIQIWQPECAFSVNDTSWQTPTAGVELQLIGCPPEKVPLPGKPPAQAVPTSEFIRVVPLVSLKRI